MWLVCAERLVQAEIAADAIRKIRPGDEVLIVTRPEQLQQYGRDSVLIVAAPGSHTQSIIDAAAGRVGVVRGLDTFSELTDTLLDGLTALL